MEHVAYCSMSQGGPDLTLFDVNQAAAIIKETAHPDVNLIFVQSSTKT